MLARVAEYRSKIIEQRGGISLIQTFKQQPNSILVARAALKGIFRLGCDEKFRDLCGMLHFFSSHFSFTNFLTSCVSYSSFVKFFFFISSYLLLAQEKVVDQILLALKTHSTCAPLLRIALLTLARLGKYCDANVIPIITEIAEKSKTNLHVYEVCFSRTFIPFSLCFYHSSF